MPSWNHNHNPNIKQQQLRCEVILKETKQHKNMAVFCLLYEYIPAKYNQQNFLGMAIYTNIMLHRFKISKGIRSFRLGTIRGTQEEDTFFTCTSKNRFQRMWYNGALLV